MPVLLSICRSCVPVYMCGEYVCILPELCAGFVVNFAGILDECRCFAEMSIHFRFGKFPALLWPKISKGHAEFFREKFCMTFANFWQ